MRSKQAGILCKARKCCWFEFRTIGWLLWRRWRGDFFLLGGVAGLGLYGCNTLRTLFLLLIKHLRFFYIHVLQWCIVVFVYLIFSNPWISYECMLLVVSLSCLFAGSLCSWASERARSWEQAARREDWINNSERHRLVDLFLLSLLS